MSNFSLKVNERKTGSKSSITKVREDSKVPGVVYGFKQEPLSFEVDYNTLVNLIVKAGTSNVIELNIGSNKIDAIIREYQKDPVSDRITHIDFLAVSEKRKFTTTVPLKIVGVSSTVRAMGGQLDQKNYTLTVKCLPGNLPSFVEVDVSKLNEIGQTILVENLDIDESVQVMNNPKDPIVQAVIPKKVKIKAGDESDGSESAEGEDQKEGAEGEDKKEGAEGEDKK